MPPEQVGRASRPELWGLSHHRRRNHDVGAVREPPLQTSAKRLSNELCAITVTPVLLQNLVVVGLARPEGCQPSFGPDAGAQRIGGACHGVAALKKGTDTSPLALVPLVSVPFF